MTDETKAIFQTFSAYSKDFGTLNPELVAPYFHLPAMLITSAQVAPISDVEEVKGIFAILFENLKKQNFKESRLDSLHINQLSQNQAIVSGIATRY